MLGAASALGLGSLGLGTIVGCDLLMPERPVTVAAHVWPGYEPLFMAAREGWCDAARARLLETGSASESLQALTEGRVDGAALTLDEVLRARASGLALSVVLVFDVSAGADKVLTRPAIRTLAELKGHPVAFESGAVGELMLAELLRAAGLNRQDLRLVPMPVDRQLDAWKAGRADAFVTYEPMASQLMAQGARELFDSRQLPNLIVDVLAIRPEALKDGRAKAVRHMVAAHFRGLDHFRTNQQDAIYRMAGHLKLPAPEVLSAFRGLQLPNLDSNHRLLHGAQAPLLDSARRLRTVLQGAGLIQGEDSLATLVREDFLPVEDHSR